MQRFLPKALLFVLLLAGRDRGRGAILQHFYSKTLYGEKWPKQNWLLRSRFDVVIWVIAHIPPLCAFDHREGNRIPDFNAEKTDNICFSIALGNLILERYAPSDTLEWCVLEEFFGRTAGEDDMGVG
jgi:hypothetical protein